MTCGVTVCIVGFRNPEDIATCMTALANQTYRNFEVIICENGGDAATATLRSTIAPSLASGQRVAIIAAPDNPGYAGGINHCIAAAPHADAYWVLNPDTEPAPQALEALVSLLVSGAYDAVGGIMLWPDNRINSCGGQWVPWLAYSRSIGIGMPLAEAPQPEFVQSRLSFIMGGALLCSRHFIERAGLMREDYFLYGEEVEWCLRARRLGLRLGYAHEALIVHHQGSTTGSGGNLASRGKLPVYCDERNRILTLRDTTSWLLPIGAMGALLTIIVRYGKRRGWRQLAIAIGAWWDGLRNQRGRPTWVR